MATTYRYFTHHDGSIEFLKRGTPPLEVPGYEPDPVNKFLFHPILPPCKARVFKDLGAECCPIGRTMRYCSKFNLYAMTPSTCISCAERGENVIELPVMERQ